jgi:prophage regulatory protein
LVHTCSILRRPSVEEATGYSRSTLYLRIDQRLFTRPVKLGMRAVGWPAAEVAAINTARIAGKTEAEIRLLVVQLERARTENPEHRA